MVDGINISNPSSHGTGEPREAVSKNAAITGDAQKIQSAKNARPRDDNAKENGSSAITKSAEKRLIALSQGNTQDYIQAAEKLINDSIPSKPVGTKLRINLDNDSGRFVYQSVDVKTGDVVTQFPTEEVLKYLSFIREQEGLVVDQKA